MQKFFEQLPDFSAVKPDEIKANVQNILTTNKKQLQEFLCSNAITFETLQTNLNEMSERLDQFWSVINHLNSVTNYKELRDAYNSCLAIISEYHTEIGQNKELYQAYVDISIANEFSALTPTEQKVVQDNIRDFKLSGVALDKEQQQQFKQLTIKYSELTNKFADNVLDSTMGWSKLITDEQQLAGIPELSLASAKEKAQAKNKTGWLFTLDFPSYYAVITYADNRELRKELYTAYVTRASDQGPHDKTQDNSDIMVEILNIRKQLAKILNFDNYCDYSLATKMAKNYNEVTTFLYDLVKKCKSQAKIEFSALTDYAQAKCGIKDLQAWDIAYVSEKMKQEQYSVSQEELRPWFPANKVLTGFFTTANKLFNIEFELVTDVKAWHQDVQCYKLYNNQQTIGYVYIDLYAREHKQGGAWMDVCKNRWLQSSTTQLPVAFLTCNFTPATNNQVSLLTHDEVLTLFHEFGHCLHHLLTKVDTLEASGINGVEWDAVELPSQFLENWCWEQQALNLISSHIDTAEPLPADKLDQLLKAKNFQSAMQMLRQLEFSLFDFELHKSWKQDLNIQQFLDEIRHKVAVVIPPTFNRFQHSFSHIFAGGYAAGYYSYKWAEVLSADAFSKFEETNIFDAKTAQQFLVNILEKGSSETAAKLFKKFRGRDPIIDPLLRHNGIEA
jgi:oligopeptidase A